MRSRGVLGCAQGAYRGALKERTFGCDCIILGTLGCVLSCDWVGLGTPGLTLSVVGWISQMCGTDLAKFGCLCKLSGSSVFACGHWCVAVVDM